MDLNNQKENIIINKIYWNNVNINVKSEFYMKTYWLEIYDEISCQRHKINTGAIYLLWQEKKFTTINLTLCMPWWLGIFLTM